MFKPVITNVTSSVFKDKLSIGDGGVSFSLFEDYILNPLVTNTNSGGSIFDINGHLFDVASNTPRVTYNLQSVFKGLLTEYASTNHFQYSEEYTNAAWTKSSSSSITADQVTAPDGTMTADLVDLSADADARVFQFGQAASSQECTFKIFARSVSGSGTFPIAVYDGGKQFDGGAGGINSVALISLTEEWQEYSITFTAEASGNVGGYVGCRRGSTTHTLDQAYIWGAQIEDGETDTSYIATTSASVTRAKDDVTQDLSNLDLSEGYTILWEGHIDAAEGGFDRVIELSNDNSDNRHTIFWNKGASDLRVDIYASGSPVATASNLGNTLGSTYRLAYTVGPNHFQAASSNGTTSGIDTNVSYVAPLTIFPGQSTDKTSATASVHENVTIYKGIFTESQLEELVG